MISTVFNKVYHLEVEFNLIKQAGKTITLAENMQNIQENYKTLKNLRLHLL